VNGAREIVGPIPLEERSKIAVSTPDRSGLKNEVNADQANMNLLGSIFVAFRYEANVLKKIVPGLRDSIAGRGANRSRAATSTTSLEVEV
jgi:hypothetical protein